MQGCACGDPLAGSTPGAPVLGRLRSLAAHPPQSLVMEGGTAADREAAALLWAKLLNCAQGLDGGACGVCDACRQIDSRVFRDLIVVDKAFFEAAKKDDKGGTDALRELLPVWGQPAHGKGWRVTIFAEAQDLNHYVANLLLKTLEEPRPGNVFVLTAPQRERLLQTLVSRSFTLTLPWPAGGAHESDASEWIAALLAFWDTGRGWFERTSAKAAADRALAQRIVTGLERELINARCGVGCGGEGGGEGAIARRLAKLGPAGLRRLDLALAAAQEALNQPTAPAALVLDWLATATIDKRG
jgi:DNA polymerase III subunit delta'